MKNYLIVGAGRSGIAAGKMLLELNETFTVYDANKDLDTAKVSSQITESGTIPFILGDVTADDLKGFDICVVSPGVPLDTPIMKTVAECNIPVYSEIELAYLYDKGSIIAITGTNGKTTTTSLVYEIMRDYDKDTLLVGNIEIPYTGLALTSKEGGSTVAEISSFQLETMITFRPKVSAILNITPDHLDRHKTMENYADIKKSIAKNQGAEDFCVLNLEDPYLKDFGSDLGCKAVYFSAYRELTDGWYYKDGTIYEAVNGNATAFINVDESNLVGLHNYENIMAAAAMTKSYGVPDEVIKNAIRNFRAVEHRIEYVATKKGVKYYNDSKGTNTDAAIKAIDAMPSTTVLIGGGYDKDADFGEWVSRFPGKVRKLVLIGQTREKIASACDAINFKDYCFAEDLEEAVKLCAEAAEDGDCCLLSPACASWGMFKCYQQRGDMFKEYVNALEA